MTALITPFRNGAVDEEAFARLVERQIDEGADVLVPCGTTGESATLSHDEHRRVVAICVETSRGRRPVIAGAGSNSTVEAIDLMRHAKEIGADAVLSVAPYYNKPSQEGLFAHFKALNDAVQIPIVVYNIPGRSAVDIRPETMARIAALPNVIGVKDSSGDPSRAAWHRELIGPDFLNIAGDDNLALAFAAYGAVGCISVVSNVAPSACAQMQAAIRANDWETAREINLRLSPVARALFMEPNPAPAKYALSVLGLCSAEVRLPMVEVAPATRAAIEAALAHAGLV